MRNFLYASALLLSASASFAVFVYFIVYPKQLNPVVDWLLRLLE